MTPPRVDLAALRERAQAATPGPWGAGDQHSPTLGHLVVQLPEHVAQSAVAVTDAVGDAAFIAAVSPDVVLALVAAVELLTKAADTFAELDMGLRALGHPTMAQACVIAENASRAALVPFVAGATEGTGG